jgi:mannose-6-phosphate isomerase-like protein (cupin superfamily)
MENLTVGVNSMEPAMHSAEHPNLFPLPARTGKMVAVMGDLYTFLVSAKETNGAFATVENSIRPQSGPPPHIHHGNDETFYIIEGTFSFLVGEQVVIAEPDTYVYVPRGMVHTFTNVGPEAGRMLVTVTPAGFEKFFDMIGTPVHSREEAFAMNEPADLEQLMTLAPMFNLEVRL